MPTAVSIRPVEEQHLERLVRLRWDPEEIGEFQWFGYRMDDALALRRRWREDGLIGPTSSYLAVVVDDATCAGWVNWRPDGFFGNWEIGIALFPEHRGHGVGTEAQIRLARYLFDTTSAHRVQAWTEGGNVAEQRALEKAGFTREGVLRGYGIRAGQWRDAVIYGRLRTDPPPPGRAAPVIR